MNTDYTDYTDYTEEHGLTRMDTDYTELSRFGLVSPRFARPGRGAYPNSQAHEVSGCALVIRVRASTGAPAGGRRDTSRRDASSYPILSCPPFLLLSVGQDAEGVAA